MKTKRILMVFSVFVALTSSTTPLSAEVPSGRYFFPLVSYELPVRNTFFAAPKHDVESVAQGNNRFALDFYKQLGRSNEHKGKNIVFSPISLRTSLAMAYAGARGTTEQEMAQVLHFDLPQHQLHPAINTLDLELHARNNNTQTINESSGFFVVPTVATQTLSIANSVWYSKSERLKSVFDNTIRTNYAAPPMPVALGNPFEIEQARQQMNSWVMSRTESTIPDLIPSKEDLEESVMVLINAIYFQARWDTYTGSMAIQAGKQFTLATGTVVSVTALRASYWPQGPFAYTKTNDLELAAVPLLGHGARLLLVRPASSSESLDQLEARLNWSGLDLAASKLRMAIGHLLFPKFTVSTTAAPREILQSLGMRSAFNQGFAEFPELMDRQDLMIDNVFHKARIETNPKGIIATAASSVAIVPVSGCEPPYCIHVNPVFDTPFLFLVQDIESGAILFLGRVMDPRET